MDVHFPVIMFIIVWHSVLSSALKSSPRDTAPLICDVTKFQRNGIYVEGNVIDPLCNVDHTITFPGLGSEAIDETYVIRLDCRFQLPQESLTE